jgi:hypothetical protein
MRILIIIPFIALVGLLVILPRTHLSRILHCLHRVGVDGEILPHIVQQLARIGSRTFIYPRFSSIFHDRIILVIPTRSSFLLHLLVSPYILYISASQAALHSILHYFPPHILLPIIAPHDLHTLLGTVAVGHTPDEHIAVAEHTAIEHIVAARTVAARIVTAHIVIEPTATHTVVVTTVVVNTVAVTIVVAKTVVVNTVVDTIVVIVDIIAVASHITAVVRIVLNSPILTNVDITVHSANIVHSIHVTAHTAVHIVVRVDAVVVTILMALARLAVDAPIHLKLGIIVFQLVYVTQLLIAPAFPFLPWLAEVERAVESGSQGEH